MPVSYEELEGSPKITFDRKGGSASRTFKIAWIDINAFFTELFPSIFDGYPAVAWVPGYSWMVAQSAEAEPFDPTKPGGVNVGSDITYSDTAKVSVKYGVPQEDQQQQAKGSAGTPGGGGDGTGPGGDKGATGGEKGSNSQPVQLVEHSVHVGAEFLTISSLVLQWASDQTPPNTTVRAGRLVPTIEHQSTWHNVVTPPWSNIRSCCGKVNSGEFLGATGNATAGGTLLFLGCEANRDITNNGAKAWTLKYKYSEKDLDPPRGKGWNYFYRAEKNAPLAIDQLRIKPPKGGGGVGNLIYDIANFKGLYNAEVVA